jgi:hypothetical protein
MPIEVEDSLALMCTNPSHAKGHIAESARNIANKRQQEREALKAKPSGFHASALVALVRNKAKSTELDRFKISVTFLESIWIYESLEDEIANERTYRLKKKRSIYSFIHKFLLFVYILLLYLLLLIFNRG